MPRPKTDDVSEERPPRRPARSNARSTYFGMILLAVLAGGAALVVFRQQAPSSAAAEGVEPEKPRPFADMPPEAPPAPRGSASQGRGKPFAPAPKGLAKDAGWQLAVALAAQADALYDQATEAKVRGDRETLNAKGALARDQYDQALEQTAVWEEEIVERYGDTNDQVRAIVRERSRWFDRVRWLHKSIAR